jgi:bis(5'-nucleosidyl)-tetraphosphatase
MNLEKSCGAVIFRMSGEALEFLAVKSKENGHWGFPKGHMEKGETEEETAMREVLEETGLSITLIDEFRAEVEYKLTDNILKKVVYFISKTSEHSVIIQQEEIEKYRWQSFVDMLDLLTFETDKKVLMKAKNFLSNLAD